jgi:hypothetical protein
MHRLTAVLEFEDPAHAVDAFNQLRARATNTAIVGMGTSRQHSSYTRVQDDAGVTTNMFFVDTFGIVRDGEYTPPPHGIPEWIQPQGAHDSYPVTDAGGNPARVIRNGRIWENTSGTVNPHAPGVSGWTDIGPVDGAEPEPEPAGYPAWQPWTSGLTEDLYQIGDRVSHNGSDWEASLGNNHWEPGSGTGWTALP